MSINLQLLHNLIDFLCRDLVGIFLQNLNVRTLEPLDVPVVVPDHVPAVDVVGHPGKVHQGREHTLEVDVVTEDEPEPEHGLAQAEDGPQTHPGEHEAPDVLEDPPDQEDGGDGQEGEHDDAEPPRVLSIVMQICLEQGKIELGGVTAIEKI